MKAFVVDVNVLIVANARGETPQATPVCALACVRALEQVQQNILVLDDLGQVFEAYKRYNNIHGQPGLGDAFLKWLYQNQYQSTHIELVDISKSRVPSALEKFDPADHIWLLVAAASQHSPTILNATDSDWHQWRNQLEQHGFVIDFLCPELMNRHA
jgi:hypothetical protein